VWRPETGQSERIIKENISELYSVRLSPNSKNVVAAGRRSQLLVRNIEDGAIKLTIKGHQSVLPVYGASFSPDGTRIISWAHDKTVKIWNAETGMPIHTLFGHADAVVSASFSSDVKRIVSTSADKTLKVWDAETGQAIDTFVGHTHPVYSASFSPDGKSIVSGAGPGGPSARGLAGNVGEIKTWDVETRRQKLSLSPHAGTVFCVKFSPDGKTIVSASGDKTLKTWDAETGREKYTLKGHTGPVMSVSISPDGKRIASGDADGKLKIWDPETGQLMLTIEGHNTDGQNAPITSVDFGADGNTIVSACVDGTIRVWGACPAGSRGPQ
jgi:WD40 repeat protein